MDDCIFCKIIKGDVPAFKLYEDENYLAFLNIAPVAEGHTLVIPKKHHRFVWDVTDPAGYFTVATKVANHLKKVSGAEAIYSYIYGQTVPHAHIHLFPAAGGTFFDAIQTMPQGNLLDQNPEAIARKYKLD